jgi:hypothetical protein
MDRALVAKTARLAVNIIMPAKAAELDWRYLSPAEQARARAERGKYAERKRNGSGTRSSHDACNQTGAPRGSVDLAIAVLKRRPDLFEKFERGEITLYCAYKQLRSKRRPTPLTPATIRRTLILARQFLEFGQRRCPGERMIARENAYQAVRADLALFRQVFPKLREAFDKGGNAGLDTAIASFEDLL